MKYVGIDYGSKKVGFAQSDDDGRIAFPLMVSPNDGNFFKDTVELIRDMKFGVVVIGESVDGNGKPNAIAKEARAFGARLEGSIDVRVLFEKEWYSTTEARKQPGREGEREVDDAAAAIILQRYLDRSNGPTSSISDTYEESDSEEVGSESW